MNAYNNNLFESRLNAAQSLNVQAVLNRYTPKGLKYIDTFHDQKIEFVSIYKLTDSDKASLFNELKGKGIAIMELTTVLSANFLKVKNGLDKYNVKYTTSGFSSTNFKINFDSFANLTDANKVSLLNELEGTTKDSLYLR